MHNAHPMNQNSSQKFRIAYIVSPHGFGHAARAAAVMAAIKARNPSVEFEIITFVPEWFFSESLPGGALYHPFDNDVGVVQVTPFLEDLPATVERLKSMLPFQGERLNYLASHFQKTGAKAVFCDIAPMGLAAAKLAAIPSVLIENFTWDWIYEGYLDQEPRLADYLAVLRETFNSADIHIQTEPVCCPTACDLTVSPTSRPPRTDSQEIREMLGIQSGSTLILVTMGGIEQGYKAFDRLQESSHCTFILPGSSEKFTRQGNLVLLPHHNGYYHPDLVNACDAVVGKLGYSTIAESYRAGVPYGFVPRNHFRETGPLADFVRREMGGVEIFDDKFSNGEWVMQIDEIISHPRIQRSNPNGADQIAEFLAEKLELPEG